MRANPRLGVVRLSQEARHGQARSPVQVTTVSGGLSRRMALACLGSGTAALLATARPDRSQAQATPPPRGEEGAAPNHFALSGAETQLTYEAATAAGGPRVTYDGPYGSHTVVGDEIRVEESALGQLVTGVSRRVPRPRRALADPPPAAVHPDAQRGSPHPLRHPGDLKWVISTIAGPPRTGALEEYRVLPLAGTARLVMV